MHRKLSSFLKTWLKAETKKPLIIRGARQVGKTWLVRDIAKSQNLKLIEINFEKRLDLESLFSSNDPKEILENLEHALGIKIDPKKSLLFLDEIQAAPHLLQKLRWFAEEMPEFAVIAAGSLLDFALEKHKFSMPVGRISYLYLEALSFEEFLDAINKEDLKKYLQNYEWKKKIPEAIHMQFMKYLKEYLIVGGMPEAVLSWSKERDLKKINQIHYDLLASYRDDFAKYSGRISIERLEEILSSIPRQLGKKFVYRDVNSDISASSLKQALNLLAKARVCNKVISTAANGLPLGAEADDKFIKVIMLDSGLCSTTLGLSLDQLNRLSNLTMINTGGMAEQLTAQLLKATFAEYIPATLHYWLRKKKGADAEIDYIIQHENSIIPIEVKAGKEGKLKSLHQFMKEKKKSIAIRINSDLPTLSKIKVKDALGSNIEYNLISIPFYLIEQLHRLVKSAKKIETLLDIN